MINLNGIKLKNRLVAASGALGYGLGRPWEGPLIRLDIVNPSALGAVTTRTLTPRPEQGNYIDPLEFEKKTPMSHLCHILMSQFPGRDSDEKKVLQKIPGGWRNNLAWWNAGIDYWINCIYPQLKGITIIANIGGFTIEDYLLLIEKLNPLDIAAIEENISCPNVKRPLENDHRAQKELFALSRKTSKHPLIIKLGVCSDYLYTARLAEECGYNAISAINTVPIVGGGYSGPGIKPIALRAVIELKKMTNLPIIGGGGVSSWKDCREFLAAGADAVSCGSVFFFQPYKPNLMLKMHRKDLS